jgi:probable rRNA maturation factor
VRNRQRGQGLDLGLLKRIVQTLLQQLLAQDFSELGVYIVAEPEIVRLNETFLGHSGSTDVITFDYREPTSSEQAPAGSRQEPRCVEIFICLKEAKVQAGRFRTTWQSELVRYVVHGVLHLCGYDDRMTRARRRMKEKEGRLLRQLAERYPLNQLGRTGRKPNESFKLQTPKGNSNLQTPNSRKASNIKPQTGSKRRELKFDA